MHFGLIGKSLSHSFSKSYFEKKFAALKLSDYTYSNFELNSISGFKDLISEHPELNGLNVTVPYKEEIIPYLDNLDDEAQRIGAVNCIKIGKGISTGYNTDVYGFRQSIKPFLEPKHNRALVLGTGGSSKAIAYTLKQIGVEVYFVTSGEKKTENSFLYSEINEIVMRQFLLIVNCTPVGMYPHANAAPDLPYHLATKDHLAYDLIYNPEQTLFLKQFKERGAITINGLSMLQLQAEKSWEIWTAE